jgi:hypothetical protein
VTAAAELEPGRAAVRPIPDRPGLQVASVASGLLLLLDAHRLTGRLPLEIQVQVSRLRHAVKLAVQAQAASQTGVASPPARGELDAGAALRSWIASQPWAQPGPQGWVYLLCFRDPASREHRPLQGQGCRGQYAGHYWGWTQDLVHRISQHRNPAWTGAGRLVQVALASEYDLATAQHDGSTVTVG